MTQTVKLKFTPVYGYVINNPEAVKILRTYLRYEVVDYAASRIGWAVGPNYVYLITAKGRFHTGLAHHVAGILKANGFGIEVDDQQEHPPLPDADFIERTLSRIPVTPRPYQEEAIFAGLERRRGMLDMCTGAGKTIVMGTLARIWGQKALVVCDSLDLAKQLQVELEEVLGEKVGLLGGGKWNPKHVTVGMVQTLTNNSSSKKRKKEIAHELAQVKHLIFDEVHHSQAQTWRKVGDLCINATLRHGFSGTCFATEVVTEKGERKNTKDLLLVSHTGPIITRVSSARLVELGYLSKPHVQIVQNVLPRVDGADYNQIYERAIVQNESRNAEIARLAKAAYDDGEQAIIFVTRIEHGHLIQRELEKLGVDYDDVAYVTGESFHTDRSDALEAFKAKDLPILIGTVLGEGLNFFAKIGINAAGGRSRKNVIQQIGRVLRKERTATGDVDTSAVRVVKYYDFQDKGHAMLAPHGKARIEVYKEEGHRVTFLEPGTLEVEEGVNITGHELARAYRLLERQYEKYSNQRFRWEPGEKKRYRKAVINFLDLIEAKDSTTGVEAWGSYLDTLCPAWASWEQASRYNLLGFVCKTENMHTHQLRQNAGKVASNVDIAGTATSDIWSF